MTVPPGAASSPAVAQSASASATSSPPASSPTSTADVRDIVGEAIAHKTPVRIVGRSTWLNAGRPVEALRQVSLDGLSGIVDYTPGGPKKGSEPAGTTQAAGP